MLIIIGHDRKYRVELRALAYRPRRKPLGKPAAWRERIETVLGWLLLGAVVLVFGGGAIWLLLIGAGTH